MIKITKRERGFTLIELLVVIAIIGILAAAGTIGYQNYIDDARQNTAEKIHSEVASYIQTIRASATGGLTLDSAVSSCTASNAACAAQFRTKLGNDGYTVAADGAGSASAGDVVITEAAGGMIVCAAATNTGCSALGAASGSPTSKATTIVTWP